MANKDHVTLLLQGVAAWRANGISRHMLRRTLASVGPPVDVATAAAHASKIRVREALLRIAAQAQGASRGLHGGVDA
jgi:hypothetical protein